MARTKNDHIRSRAVMSSRSPPTFKLVASVAAVSGTASPPPLLQLQSVSSSASTSATIPSSSSSSSSSLHPYALQIGGKHHTERAVANPWAKMFLHDASSSSALVFKPVTSGVRGATEVAWYRCAFPDAVVASTSSSAATDNSTKSTLPLAAVPVCVPLLKFLPRFHGLATITADSGVCAEYLRLSDLTAGYRRPSVADLKIGTQTFDDDAPAKKRESEMSKFPDQATLGFRFTGMKVFDAQAGAYVEYSKSFCHGLDAKSYMRGFHAYFQDGRVSVRIVSSLLQQVTHLLHVIECHNRHRFIASSLLLVYDSDDSDSAPRLVSGDAALSLECEWCVSKDAGGAVDTSSTSLPHYAARAHCIDFGHVTPLIASQAADGSNADAPAELRDHGYAHGLRTICSALRTLVAEYAHK